MSTPLPTTDNTAKPLTYVQRSAAAAVQANERFGFTDEKRMQAALSEVALDELSRSPAFAVRVRNRYEELTPQKATRATKTGRTPPTKPTLVPIKEFPGFQLDATRALDPWFVIEYFGEGQLETALRLQPIGNLRKAIAVVEARYPGTAPKGKLTKERAVAYILEYALQ